MREVHSILHVYKKDRKEKTKKKIEMNKEIKNTNSIQIFFFKK